jgi:hypothetical protein
MRSDSPGLEVNSSSNGRDTHVVIPFETPSVDNDRGPNLSQAHVRRWSDINDQEQLELEDDLDGAIPTRNLLRNPNWCWANGSNIRFNDLNSTFMGQTSRRELIAICAHVIMSFCFSGREVEDPRSGETKKLHPWIETHMSILDDLIWQTWHVERVKYRETNSRTGKQPPLDLCPHTAYSVSCFHSTGNKDAEIRIDQTTISNHPHSFTGRHLECY